MKENSRNHSTILNEIFHCCQSERSLLSYRRVLCVFAVGLATVRREEVRLRLGDLRLGFFFAN
ncbi:MAG: hypothetical protein ICV55_08420 [Coleofasciculus sp. C3-bin4]|nr:hypothetical protein [Coleofasciculus sp. C3-bin4]